MRLTRWAAALVILLLTAAVTAGCSGTSGGSVLTEVPQQATREIGRFVPFGSGATNLVPDDTNDQNDIFVYDRTLAQVSRVSLSSEGEQSDGGSDWPSVSWDGRYVAFQSSATNLVPDDTNDQVDIFVRDRTTGTTERVSVASDGTEADDSSEITSISADGRYVAFESFATNLVADDTNDAADVFVHDRTTGETTRVSVASGGAQADGDSRFPSLSADGRFVAFYSFATDLVPDDTNDSPDIFVHDRMANTTVRVSVDSQGAQANQGSLDPTISADGRFVAFTSYATNLVPDDTNDNPDVFRHDLQTGATIRVSLDDEGAQWPYGGWSPRLSPDGGRVSFTTGVPSQDPTRTKTAQGLGPALTNIVGRDIDTGGVELISANPQGQPGDGYSEESVVGLDAKRVFFSSSSTDLVPDDTNEEQDVFERDLETHTTTRLSVGPEGVQSDGYSYLFEGRRKD